MKINNYTALRYAAVQGLRGCAWFQFHRSPARPGLGDHRTCPVTRESGAARTDWLEIVREDDTTMPMRTTMHNTDITTVRCWPLSLTKRKVKPPLCCNHMPSSSVVKTHWRRAFSTISTSTTLYTSAENVGYMLVVLCCWHDFKLLATSTGIFDSLLNPSLLSILYHKSAKKLDDVFKKPANLTTADRVLK